MSQDKTFKDLKLSNQIINALKEKGYEYPTTTQLKIIPPALSGQDIIGIAPTGTGKTAAYLIPLLQKLKYAQEIHPRALVLAPTKELVIQIHRELEQIGKYYDIRSVAIYGGTGIKNQITEIQAGKDILVSTPGRLLDIYSREGLNTRLIKTTVIDEADKMLDMGFLPQINRILEILPFKKRQNLLFSATFPEKVEKLTFEFLEFPVIVKIQAWNPVRKNIRQYFYKTPNLKTKINLLSYLLKDKKEFKRVIIFTKTKETANNVFKFIARKIDENVKVIHANKSQNTRINTINAFKEGNIRILVTTDLTSRGIDIKNVSHVINFDFPVIHEDYIHRIGRTGRINHIGISLSFVSPPDQYHLSEIEKLIKSKIPEKKLPVEIETVETEASEKKKQELEIDRIKRKLDPEYKGAYHKRINRKRENWKLKNQRKKRK